MNPVWGLAAITALAACSAIESGDTAGEAATEQTLTLETGPYGPTLSVSVAGSEPRNLAVLFDTGAGISVLDHRAVDESGLKTLDDVNVSSGGASAERARMYRADLRFENGAESKDAALLLLDLASRGGPFADGIAGILSPSALPFPLIEIDFSRGVVRRASRAPRSRGTAFTAPAFGLPQTRVRIAGEDIDAVIDSGARDFLSLPLTWSERLSFLVPPVPAGGARTVVDETEILAGTLDGSVSMGGRTFRNPRISFDPLQSLALIGRDALAYFVVTLDYDNGEAWMTPSESE